MKRMLRGEQSPMLVFAIAVAAFVLVAGIATAAYEEELYNAQNEKAINEQAQILAASVEAAVFFGDARTAQEYIDALKVNPQIEAAAVYDKDGRVFAQFTQAGKGVSPRTVSGLETGLRDGHLNVTVPVMQERARVGTIYLRARSEAVQRQILRYTGIALLLIMGATVLTVIGMSQRALTRVNAELERRAKDLSLSNAQLQAEMEERRKTEAALRQSQKMEAMGQLSGGIAHDFNNLITIIKGSLQLLRRRLAQGKPDISRYIDSAEEGLNRASSLTQRILAFSRQQPLSPKPVLLDRLIKGMMELIRQSVGDGIEIQTGLQAAWWTICDANQMENVILNLAINARDAMPEGGRLFIETRQIENATQSDIADFIPGDYVELTLRDTGAGMSEEVRQRAFDPFFTTKPQGRGTGLGLSMTFGFVRQSNGYLRIDTELGKGTAIVILMPRYVAAQQTAEEYQ